MSRTRGIGFLKAAFLSAAIAIGTVGPTLSAARTEAAGFKPTSVTPWAVLLCAYSDQPVDSSTGIPPGGKDPAYFKNLFTEAGKGKNGLFDYWQDVSYNQLHTTGSQVYGWYTMSLSWADDQKTTDRFKRLQACVDAAVSTDNLSFSAFYGIIAILNAPTGGYSSPEPATITVNGKTDSGAFGGYGLVVLGSGNWNVSVAAHEMGHEYNMSHTYDAALTQCSSNGGPGEYCDPYDTMSADVNLWSYENTGNTDANLDFGESGPGLTAFSLDTLGWISGDRTFTDNGGDPPLYAQTVTLAALNHPEASTYLEARATVDPSTAANPDGLPYPPSYYSIEFRYKDGWDRGIPWNGVVIHEIAPGADKQYYSFLVDRQGSAPWLWLPGQTFHDVANNISITVDSIDASAKTATITIGLDHAASLTGGGGGGPTPSCGGPGGPVCVTPDGPPVP